MRSVEANGATLGRQRKPVPQGNCGFEREVKRVTLRNENNSALLTTMHSLRDVNNIAYVLKCGRADTLACSITHSRSAVHNRAAF